MAKFLQIVLVVGLIAVGSAEPPRRFNQRFQNRNRFFARQEVATNAAAAPQSAVTPYPPAGEKPDIPFDLPNQEAAPFPDPTYGPPDQTYGPPDQTYGPPQPEADLPEEPEDYDEQTTDEPEAERLVFVKRRPGQSSRLVLQKGQRTFRPQGSASAQLRRPAPSFAKSSPRLRQSSASSARLQRQNLIAQPILLQDGTLVYSIPI
ncbi:uncharacterized protein LOC129919712 [Episyrphus balteatus]|uniref:uncharacterized protein LOC129919712 n=1 Tax=Episyrphus balteatus TaxID=286459 RepID=UPI0024862B6E|nr:uncharacterized protein LOC129919712 [Episyrphus balteatus]